MATRIGISLRILIALGVAWISAWTAPVVSAAESVEDRNMAVVRAAHAALASGDFETFRSYIGRGYVRHCQAMPPGLQELHGTEEFFSFLEEFLVAVPEYEDTLSQMMADGDRVAYVSTMSGTHTGPLGDVPATGRVFTLVNVIIQRLENGKIVETWVSWDNVAFLTQLGLMPPAASGAGSSPEDPDGPSKSEPAGRSHG